MTVPAPRPAGAEHWDRRRTLATERMFGLLAATAGLLAAGALVASLSDVLLLVFAAILMACLLRGGAEALERRFGGPPQLWLAVIVIGIVGGTILAFWLRGPMLAREVSEVWRQLSDQARDLWNRLGTAEWLKPLVERLQAFIDEGTRRVAGLAAGFATSTFGTVGSLVVVLVAALYFALDPGLYVAGTLRLLPRSWRPRGALVLADMTATLRWWFLGQALDMVAVGVLTYAGLALLGLKLAFTLALIAGLFNFVPYIGALAGAVPAVLVGLGEGPQTALWVMLLFVAVQTIEGNIIAPLVQKQTVELAPVLTILSQTVLGTLFGPLALILATPITAVAVVAVRRIYVEGVLGDEDPAGAPAAKEG